MTADTQARLITMANQIARNFQALGHDHATAATADHIAKFWDPRMKAQIIALAEKRDDALGPIAGAAVMALRGGAEPASQTGGTVFNGVDEPGHSDAG